MPDWIAVLLLGVIEGITEFLPVSSTGHLLIAESLFRAGGLLKEGHWLVAGGGAKDLFNIVIQSGAVLAVLPLFPDRLRQFAFKWREKATQDYALKILVAFVLTGVGGLILEKNGFKLPDEARPVAWALLIGGVGFVAIEGWLRGRKLSDDITWTIAISVGLGQLIAAIFPGTSRSGATILCCLLIGLNRPAATEFSFLVGIPTMLAAGGLKIFKALHHPPPGSLPPHWDMVLLGFVVSAVVSFIAVKWLLRYVQTHTFVIFGWYRMAAAVVIFAMLTWNSGAFK